MPIHTHGSDTSNLVRNISSARAKNRSRKRRRGNRSRAVNRGTRTARRRTSNVDRFNPNIKIPG